MTFRRVTNWLSMAPSRAAAFLLRIPAALMIPVLWFAGGAVGAATTAAMRWDQPPTAEKPEGERNERKPPSVQDPRPGSMIGQGVARGIDTVTGAANRALALLPFGSAGGDTGGTSSRSQKDRPRKTGSDALNKVPTLPRPGDRGAARTPPPSRMGDGHPPRGHGETSFGSALDRTDRRGLGPTFNPEQLRDRSVGRGSWPDATGSLGPVRSPRQAPPVVMPRGVTPDVPPHRDVVRPGHAYPVYRPGGMGHYGSFGRTYQGGTFRTGHGGRGRR